MNGHVVAHGEDAARGVKYGAGVIAALFDVGGKCGTTERRSHLFRDRMKEVLENLQGLFSAMLSIEPGYRTSVLAGADSYLESHSANISPDWNLSVFGLDLRRFDV